jgi:glycosyltransferase involved in cell wall biosynthesis
MEFCLRAPIKWLVPAISSEPVQKSASAVASVIAPSPKVTLGRRLYQKIWRALLHLLDGGEILYNVGPSPQLLAWIREFQPEVIYGHSSDLISVRFLRSMQQALDLPLVLHCMDDWPETLYCNGLFSKLLRPRYLAEFSELVSSADVVIAICQEMAVEYEKRYKRQVLWLPMPVDLGAYQNIARTQWTAAKPFRVEYGGRVGWAIRESLADIALTVHTLRQENVDVSFDIVTSQREDVPDVCRDLTGVGVQALRSLAEVPRCQADADLLVVCYDFDPESFMQARYSMPAKLAACMASGTPILVYGPAGLPVVEYARREGWGKVVDQRDPEALRAAILNLLNSETLRKHFGLIARRLAAERHDNTKVSERFRAVLQELN